MNIFHSSHGRNKIIFTVLNNSRSHVYFRPQNIGEIILDSDSNWRFFNIRDFYEKLIDKNGKYDVKLFQI